MKKLYALLFLFLSLFLVACNVNPNIPDVKLKFELRFMLDDNTVYQTYQVGIGDDMIWPEAPIKEGYTFDGWFANGEKFEGTKVVTDALTLYAHFTSNVTLVTVNFFEGLKLLESVEVEAGSTISGLYDTNRDDATFEGWFLDLELTQSFDYVTPVTSNINLYGKWTPIEYTVTIYNGNLIFTQFPVQKGKTIGPINTTIEGYNFIGLFKDSMFVTPYNDEPITSNTTLYGKWEQIISTVTVTYYRGNTVFATRNITPGNTAPDVDTTVSGYTFNGWYLDALFTQSYNNTPINANTNLYGKWTANGSGGGDDYTGYYASLSGLTGNSLLNAMYTLLNNTGQYETTTYGDARYYLEEADVWVGFNENYIYLIYSDILVGNNKPDYPYGNYAINIWDYNNDSTNTTWNREHVWAKSTFRQGNTDPSANTRGISADLHNLRAADTNVNSSRSNNPFTNQISQNAYGNYSGKWYPGDNHRGDVARILFYMDIRWGNATVLSDMGTLSTLLAWHELDPVDDFERNRNEVIYKYQKNRNPFIDHPELASTIYN